MCDCETCLRGREFEAWRETIPEDARQFADDMWESMCAAQDEAAYYHAIVKGDWPNCEAILRRGIMKARAA